MSADERGHDYQPRTAGAPGGLPGAWGAALITIISALIAGFLVRPGAEAASPAPSAVSGLAEVAPDDVGAALNTVAASPATIAKFRAEQGCRRKLAWVTIARLPDRPAGRVRLQSGKYISPAFELTEVPVRVAIPYPAPYSAGRGTISVVGTSSDAQVALTPPWKVSAGQGFQTHDVTWTPIGCLAASQPGY